MVFYSLQGTAAEASPRADKDLLPAQWLGDCPVLSLPITSMSSSGNPLWWCSFEMETCQMLLICCVFHRRVEGFPVYFSINAIRKTALFVHSGLNCILIPLEHQIGWIEQKQEEVEGFYRHRLIVYSAQVNVPFPTTGLFELLRPIQNCNELSWVKPGQGKGVWINLLHPNLLIHWAYSKVWVFVRHLILPGIWMQLNWGGLYWVHYYYY